MRYALVLMIVLWVTNVNVNAMSEDSLVEQLELQIRIIRISSSTKDDAKKKVEKALLRTSWGKEYVAARTSLHKAMDTKCKSDGTLTRKEEDLLTRKEKDLLTRILGKESLFAALCRPALLRKMPSQDRRSLESLHRKVTVLRQLLDELGKPFVWKVYQEAMVKHLAELDVDVTEKRRMELRQLFDKKRQSI